MNILNALIPLLTTISIGATTQPHQKITNLTSYPYTTVATNWYRTTENKTIFTPLVLVLDFSDDTSVYDLNTNTFNYSNFRGNFSAVELALISAAGNYSSNRYSTLIDFTFLQTTTDNPYLRLNFTFYNAGAATYHTENIYFSKDNQFHSMAIEYEFTPNTTSQNINFRWGLLTADISTPYTSNAWEIYDASTSYYNSGWRFSRNGSSMSVSTWSSVSEQTQFKFTDTSSLDDAYFNDLINYYYELGQKQADSTTLINGFQSMVGILVNMVLMILNLSVLNVSLMDIFGVLMLIVGVIWTLKLIRG
jgi:hypothetical protein